ncbi:sulfotransferase 6B1-like isoform X2 [Hyla sarda]|uniref:sulfotransferase 6B1-like isoform X2 n=1 Tax=Hyla sarda TaxID=327740 RepID=UPI0024C44EA9|nr:sulfotransferase 6B1-like isoform X2 [Hyla sarda]
MSMHPRPTGKNDRAVLLEMIHSTTNTSAEDLLFSYKGMLYPSILCSLETFQALETFEAREDDLLVATYPKNGTNWLIQILCEIVSLVHHREPLPDATMIEFGSPEILARFKDRPSPRILSTHLDFKNIPKSFFEKKVKILLVLRNPKDTAVSFYQFHNSLPALPSYNSWATFFKDFTNGTVVYGQYFDFVATWEKHFDEKTMMAITFEEMKLDFPSAVKKISEFFQFSLTEEQIHLVANRTTFNSMKEKSENTHGKLGDSFFRKGEIGDWKNYFTEDQSKVVDTMFEKYLAGTKLGKMLNYDKYCKF